MSRRGLRRRLLPLAVLAVLLAVSCGDRDLLGVDALPSTTLGEAGDPTTVTPTDAPSTAPPPTEAPKVVSVAPRRVRLTFTGDTMAHDAVNRSGARNGEVVGRAYDFDPMWRLVQPVISRADLAVCHLETTLSTTGAAPTGFPRFRAPSEFATAIRTAGYDTCTTASNHSFDYGRDGVVQTIDALTQAGLSWSGTARTAEEDANPPIITAAGVRVAVLSATYGLNGFRLPEDQAWLVDLIDVPQLLADAAAARAAGAEIVVVSLHCCAEYRTEPTAAQADYAHQLLASPDVDLVVGHHAHVVQPIERVGDEWAIYGLGNILSNMYESKCCPASSQDGVIVEVEFAEGEDGRFVADHVAFTPTWVDRQGGHVIVPVRQALTDPTLPPARRAELDASYLRTVAAIDSRGAIEAGVVVNEN